MSYIKRNIENTIEKAAKMFYAILVTGTWQVGKTTVLKHITKELSYITLSDPFLLQNAIEEAGSFFKIAPPPVIIGEIQYAPNLFIYIKMIADKNGKKGQFYLTSSQQFKMMKNVNESLAGRIGIINLLGLSLREINDDDFNEAFIPTEEYISKRSYTAKNLDYNEIWKVIHKGSMPAMYVGEMDWKMFYASYTKTYIEREVRELTQVSDDLKFIKFMIAIASRTAQVLNLKSVAYEIGISVHVADKWLSILISSNIVYLLQPYNNIMKKAETPKIFFLDTGLAAYLTKWNNSEVLEAGAMAEAFFETFVVSEVLKSYYNSGILEPNIYYYRDDKDEKDEKDEKEIDLIIEKNGILHPIKINKTANPRKEHIEDFSVLAKISGISVGKGCLVCMYDKNAYLDSKNVSIPVTWI